MVWHPHVVIIHSNQKTAFIYAEYIKTSWFGSTDAIVKSFTLKKQNILNYQYLQNARMVLVLFDKVVLEEMKQDQYYKNLFNGFDRKMLQNGYLTGFVGGTGSTRQEVAKELQTSNYVIVMEILTSWQLHDYPEDGTEEGLKTQFLDKCKQIGCKEVQHSLGGPRIIHHRPGKEIMAGDNVLVYFGANLLDPTTEIKGQVIPLDESSVEDLDVYFTFIRRIPKEDIVMLKVPSDCRLGSGVYRLRFITSQEQCIGYDVVIQYMSMEDHLQYLLLQEKSQEAAIRLLCKTLNTDKLDKQRLEEKLIRMYEEMSPDELSKFDWNSMVNRMNRIDGKSTEQLPTLLHFAAYYGLQELCKYLCENHKAASALALCITNVDSLKAFELVDVTRNASLAEYLGQKRVDLDIYLFMRGNNKVYDYVRDNFGDKRQSEEISVPLYITMNESSGRSDQMYRVKMKKSDYMDTYGTEIDCMREAYMDMTGSHGASVAANDVQDTPDNEIYEQCEESFYSNLNTARASVRFADDDDLNSTSMRIESYNLKDNMYYQHDIEINSAIPSVSEPEQVSPKKKTIGEMFKRFWTKKKTQKPPAPSVPVRRERLEAVEEIYYAPLRPEAPSVRESVISNSSTSSGESQNDTEAPPPIPPRAPSTRRK